MWSNQQPTVESENIRPTDRHNDTKERPADISEEYSVIVLVFTNY